MSLSTLRKLPVELRDMIFKDVLYEPWNGKTPDLVKALRSDAQLYQEALAVFAKLNTFILNKRNGWELGDLSKEATTMIQKVKVEFSGNYSDEELSYQLRSQQDIQREKSQGNHYVSSYAPPPTLSAIQGAVTRLDNVSKITIHLEDGDSILSFYFRSKVHYLSKFAKLSSVFLEYSSTRVFSRSQIQEMCRERAAGWGQIEALHGDKFEVFLL